MADAMGETAIPGTEAITNKIKGWQKVNTTEFADVQSSLKRAAGQAGSSHQQLQGTINNLSAAWQGKDADSYRGYMQTFADASKAAHELLNEGVKSVGDAVRQLDEAKRDMQAAVDQMISSYNSQLKGLRGHDGGAPDDGQKEKLGKKVAGEVEGKVDAAVKKAEQAMKTLSGALAKQTSRMHQTYGGVPSPGSAGSGGPLHSTPVSYSGGGGGAGGGGLGASGGPPSGGPPPGNVQQWIDQAIAELRKAGVNVSPSDKQLIWQIIQKESGGNPHAINNWDSNAAAGHPSKGLMQCIDSTFQSNKLPGHGDIYNPVDNICAGVKYSISRYGSLSDVPGIKAMSQGGGYVGY